MPVMNMLRPSSVPATSTPASFRLGQNLQRGDLGNVFAPDFSVPGMRRMEHIVESPEQLIRGIIDGVAENTGKLARKPYFGMP